MNVLSPPFNRTISDHEREQHVQDCGRLFLKAHTEGDMDLAGQWLQRQAEAVASRSPEYVRLLERQRGLE